QKFKPLSLAHGCFGVFFSAPRNFKPSFYFFYPRAVKKKPSFFVSSRPVFLRLVLSLSLGACNSGAIFVP
ncbi:MAG: hypothetical protein LBF38_10465, partial [Deltaproteobacteria bacterium]|nr:hypothetical protein [Deltaproteobacteria bacterium]